MANFVSLPKGDDILGMAKRKIIFYLVTLGILFVATLILIFSQKSLFKIGADTVPTCGGQSCTSNPGLNLSVFWNLPTADGVDSLGQQFNNYKTAVAAKFNLITFSANPLTTNGYGDAYQLALNQAKETKALNPSDQVLTYRWTIFKTLFVDPDIISGKLDPNGTNKECFLRYQSGDKINQPIKLTRAYLMDVSSQCWKDYLVNDVKDKAGQYNVDGIVLDGVTPTLAETNIGNITDADLPDGYADNWKVNIQNLLAYMKAQLPDKKVLWVGLPCNLENTDNNCSKDFIPYGDGFMYERFSFWKVNETPSLDSNYDSPAFLSPAQFKQNLDLVTDAQSQNKITYLSNWVRPQVAISEAPVQKFQRFLQSSYLLVSGPKTYYGITIDDTQYPSTNDAQNHSYSKINFFKDWDINVGESQDKYTTQNDVYLRQFSKALVVVNPNDEAKSITLDKTYYTPEGMKISGNYTLADHTGQILLLNNDGGNTDNGSSQNQTSENPVGQLLSTGTSIYYLILIVLTILLTVLLKQYAKKN